MKVYGLPKVPPRPKADAYKTRPDGSQVCSKTAAGRRDYIARLMIMVRRQEEVCAICLRWFVIDRPPTFDHQDGRGFNGAWRDDRVEIDGQWYNAAVCEACNGQKGSRRYRWQDGKYIPIEARA